MENEIWKPIPGFEGYEASDLGRVRSHRIKGSNNLSRGYIILRGGTKKKGYKYVILRNNGLSFNMQVHAIVMQAFFGQRPEGKEVCHNNGDKTDNRLSNLRYDTHAGNMRDAVNQGKMIKSVDGRQRHVNQIQRNIIRKYIGKRIIELYETGMKYHEISKRTGYTISGISRIVNGNRRKYLRGATWQEDDSSQTELQATKRSTT